MSDSTRVSRIVLTGVLALGVSRAGYPQSASRELAWIGGVQYATGDYIFTERTWNAYLSNGLTWNKGWLRLTATLPIVMQDAGWVQYGAGMMLPTGGMADTARSGSMMSGNNGGMMGRSMHGGTMTPSADMPFRSVGIGDPMARAELDVARSESRMARLSLVGAAKAPLADVKQGFGTGEWDAGLGLSTSTTLGGVMVFGDAMYWSLGNPPGASLRNVVVYGVSVGRPLGGYRWSVLASVTGATRYWPGVDAPAQAGASVGYLLESGSSVIASSAFGLTRTAPTFSLGLGWRVPFGRRQ